MLSRQSRERLWPVCLSGMASCPTRSSPPQPPVWRAGAFPSRAARKSFLLNRRRVQLGVSLFRIIFFFLWSLSLSWSLLSLSFIAYCADGGPSPQPSAARPGPWSDKVDRSCWSRWRPTVLWIAVVVTFYVTRHRLRRRLEAARSKRQRQHPATSAQMCQARRRHWVQTKLV